MSDWDEHDYMAAQECDNSSHPQDPGIGRLHIQGHCGCEQRPSPNRPNVLKPGQLRPVP